MPSSPQLRATLPAASALRELPNDSVADMATPAALMPTCQQAGRGRAGEEPCTGLLLPPRQGI